MKNTRWICGLVACLALLFADTSRAAAQPRDGVYLIQPDVGGPITDLAFDVPNGSRTPVTIQLYWLHFQANQLWRFTRLSDGSYKIQNVHSGLVLDVPDGSRNPGVPIQQFYWHGGDNQRWHIESYTSYWTHLRIPYRYHRIYSKASGLALDLPGGLARPHNYIQQYTPHGGWSQRWLLPVAP